MASSPKKPRKVQQKATPQLYKVSQVAEILQLSDQAVRKNIKDGQIKVHRFGRSIRISKADLDAFIKSAAQK